VADLAAHSHLHDAHAPEVAHQFEDPEQQREADSLGMWTFLVTEIMFFGALFAAYVIYRSLYPAAFEAGSHLLEVKFGATNTAVLIGSSLTMVLAIYAAQTGKSKSTIITFLVLTMLLGAAFIGIKLHFEWFHDYAEGLVPGINFNLAKYGSGVELFMVFYFFMTGLHALHMVIGLGILTVLVVMTARGRFSPGYYAPLDISGLYWHFVDIIWIFLFPLLYLIGGRYTHGGH
jgi:cytochrome c oxidase subunit 3